MAVAIDRRMGVETSMEWLSNDLVKITESALMHSDGMGGI